MVEEEFDRPGLLKAWSQTSSISIWKPDKSVHYLWDPTHFYQIRNADDGILQGVLKLPQV